MPTEGIDPKGLIREAYRIEAITGPECRSIFLDWALSLPDEFDSADALRALLEHYAGAHPHHPMTLVLQEGLQPMTGPKRRGARRLRRAD